MIYGGMREYRYYLSSGIKSSIRIKISYIELSPFCGPLSSVENLSNNKDVETKSTFLSFDLYRLSLEQFVGNELEQLRDSAMSEVFVTAQIFSDGLPMHPMLISTKGPTKCSETSLYWNEWLSFPLNYRDLTRHAHLVVNVWGVGWTPLGGSTIPLFTHHGVLRDGLQGLRIWKDREADPSPASTTPFEVDDEWNKQECFRLDKLREKYDRKEIPSNEWMDGVTDRRISRIRRGYEPPGQNEPWSPFCVYRDHAVLWIEMPFFEYPVIYEEEPYSQRNLMAHTVAANSTGSTTTTTGEYNLPKRTATMGHYGSLASNGAHTSTNGAGGINYLHDSDTTSAVSTTGMTPGKFHLSSSDPGLLISIWDPDMNAENPAERKYRKLARDILRGSIDPNLKPSRNEKARIEVLLATPTDSLKNEDKDLLWKFRYTLTDNKKAVIKFLLSVDWNDETEVKQAIDLLHQWCEIDIADALKLLGREKEFKHENIRNFAVSTLSKATNEEILDYLLQLVQALRYEKKTSISRGPAATSDETSRGIPNSDAESERFGQISGETLGPLARFLIDRSTTSFQMANYFYWYLRVEASDVSLDAEIFRVVLTKMMDELKQDEEKRLMYEMLMAQRDFMDRILTCQAKAREEKGKKDQKEEKLRQYLKQLPWPKGMLIRLPLDPNIYLSGIAPASTKMFKSALYPAVIQFQTVQTPQAQSGAVTLNASMISSNGDITEQAPSRSLSYNESSVIRESLPARMIQYLNRDREGPMYKVMVKNGDDLRQDQLIMQMFILMDRLLKKVNLDLKLTPYRILATGIDNGLMEFVQDSYPVSYVVSNFESPQVLSFLRKHHPDPHGDYGVAPEALSNYIKSVAGYCVLTYLLGIGDRHLDNLMMKTEGHLFHIDFGFIFGADPKLLPPPFKLTKEMVEGMGGLESVHYLRFKTYCCQAYNWLRKSADLILNLLSLMVDAGIEELTNDPETTLQKVQEKFRLDLTDEQAEQFFLGLINDSVTALFPVLMEYIHKVATRLR